MFIIFFINYNKLVLILYFTDFYNIKYIFNIYIIFFKKKKKKKKNYKKKKK